MFTVDCKEQGQEPEDQYIGSFNNSSQRSCLDQGGHSGGGKEESDYRKSQQDLLAYRIWGVKAKEGERILRIMSSKRMELSCKLYRQNEGSVGRDIFLLENFICFFFQFLFLMFCSFYFDYGIVYFIGYYIDFVSPTVSTFYSFIKTLLF